MNPNKHLNGCEVSVHFCFMQYIKVCDKNCLNSLDVSEMFLSRVSSMYIFIMHYLHFFLSCSIKNLTLAPLSCLFTIKGDVLFFSFYKF